MSQLVRANLHFLDQATQLLDRIDDHLYTTPVISFHGSTIGGHIRHCLEHYQSLLACTDGDCINYDARQRDHDVETRTASAVALIAHLADRLDANAAKLADNRRIDIQMACGCDDDGCTTQVSTVGRELQFLVSHTVHHFAMITGLCNALGLENDRDFGVAPSTLQHRAAESKRA